MRLVTMAAALGCATALISPAAASAAEFHVEGTTAVYTGDPDSNHVSVNGEKGADFFQLDDNGRATVTGGPCVRDESSIVCPISAVTSARFDLGDGDDELLTRGRDEGVTTTSVPLTINGGAGDDVLVGDILDDTIDAGDGKDDVAGIDGDDKVSGGAGDDNLRGGNGGDTIDGGAGDDFVNGMDGNDFLRPGAGHDDLRGGDGDDQVDMRNGEVDKGEAVCEAGTDSIALDAKDQVLETKLPGGTWNVEPSCEQPSGQAAPTPINLFSGTLRSGKPTITVDLIEALPTTIKIELLIANKVVSRATVKRRDTRTTIAPKRTAAGAKFKNRYFLTVVARIAVTDSGGRKSVTKKTLGVPSI